MLHRPIVTAAIAAILAMEVPAQPVAAMMATTPSQLRGATTADKSRTGRVASPASLAPALLALVFPPVLAATTMRLALAPSPASPPPCTARDRESS